MIPCVPCLHASWRRDFCFAFKDSFCPELERACPYGLSWQLLCF